MSDERVAQSDAIAVPEFKVRQKKALKSNFTNRPRFARVLA